MGDGIPTMWSVRCTGPRTFARRRRPWNRGARGADVVVREIIFRTIITFCRYMEHRQRMSIGLVDFANNQTMAVSLHACALGGHLTRCYTTGHKHKYVGQVCGLRVQERAMEYLLGLAW